MVDTLFWGHKGEMRLHDLRDQTNRASCLRLVAAIVILYNAAYLQAAVKCWRSIDQKVTDEQLAHIFPTSTTHIRFLGNYSFHDEPALATEINALPLLEPKSGQLEFLF